MARNSGDEDVAFFRDGEYLIVVDDQEKVKINSSGMSAGVRVLSASTSAVFIDPTQHVVLCNATAATFVATLPSASLVQGKSYTIKKIDVSANHVCVSGSNNQTLDGAAHKLVNSHQESITVVSDGSQWHVTAFFSGNLGV